MAVLLRKCTAYVTGQSVVFVKVEVVVQGSRAGVEGKCYSKENNQDLTQLRLLGIVA